MFECGVQIGKCGVKGRIAAEEELYLIPHFGFHLPHLNRLPAERRLPGFFQFLQVGVDRQLIFACCGDLQAARTIGFANSGMRRGAKRLLESLGFVGRHFAEETGVGLSEQERCGEVLTCAQLMRDRGQLERGAYAARERHLGSRDRQTAFAQVVAGANQAGLNRGVQGKECLRRLC